MKFTMWALLPPFAFIAFGMLIDGKGQAAGGGALFGGLAIVWFWFGVLATLLYWAVRIVKYALKR